MEVSFQWSSESLTKQVTFEARLEGGEEVSVVGICGKFLPSRGSSSSKAPKEKHAAVIKE